MRQLILCIVTILSFVSCNNDPSIQLRTAKLKRIISYANTAKNQIRGMTTFEYDTRNNLIKQSEFYTDTAKAYSYLVFEYENDRKTFEYKYDLTNDIYSLSQKKTYKYNWDLLIKNEVMKLPDSIVTNYTLYFYDKNRNLIQTSEIQCVGENSNHITEYEYDSDNLKTKTIHYEGNSGMKEYIKHYYENKLLVNEKVYTTDDQLISENNYEYDSNSYLIKQTVIIAGKKMHEESIIYANMRIVEKISYDFFYTDGSHGYYMIDAVYEYEK